MKVETKSVIDSLLEANSKSDGVEAEYLVEELFEYIVIDDGIWEDDGKYSYNYTILKIQGKYYGFSQSRSGSYYDSFYHSVDEIKEVEKAEASIKISIDLTGNKIKDESKIVALLEALGLKPKISSKKGWD